MRMLHTYCNVDLQFCGCHGNKMYSVPTKFQKKVSVINAVYKPLPLSGLIQQTTNW